jgi:lipid-binding SYLF domain-containing protein
MTRKLLSTTLVLAVGLMVAGCGESSKDTEPESKPTLKERVAETESLFRSRVPDSKRFFESSYGRVTFPGIGSGALIVGGAHGRGLVYKEGKLVGSATVTQADIGLQIGGQVYDQIIFFKDKYAFATFTGNALEFAADAQAVIVKSGAGVNADYENGVVALVMPKAGAMAKASIGGQKFKYTALPSE